MRSPDITLICWRLSLDIDDGGGKRVRAFLSSLSAIGLHVDLKPVGPSLAQVGRPGAQSRLHVMKRNFFPVPLRSTAMRDLRSAKAPNNPILSLVPAAHRWAIDSGKPAWLDYFDLWSQFSGPPTTSKTAAIARKSQRSLWGFREKSDVTRARVVSCASDLDARRVSRSDAEHLPTPVIERNRLNMKWQGKEYADRHIRAGFIANFGYEPNRAAYNLLVTQWVPKLREFGIDEITVAGYKSELLKPSHGILIHGPVASVADFYEQIDIAVAPVPSGGGMKVKVVEALAHGIPVISSDHALDGIPPEVAAVCTRFSMLSHEKPLHTQLGWKKVQEVDLSRFTREDFEETVGRLWLRLTEEA